jgi:hypothetical protein
MERTIRTFTVGDIQLMTDLGAEACIAISDFEETKDYKDTLLDRLSAIGCESISYGDHNTNLFVTITQDDDSPAFRALISTIVDNYLDEAKEAARETD